MVEYQSEKFIDDTEITVEQWAEFVVDGNSQHKPNLELIQHFAYAPLFYPTSTPDSMYRAFGKLAYFDLPVVGEYFDTLNYIELRNILDYPISGISYESAIAYCNWRTNNYNGELTNHTRQSIRFVLPDSVVLQPFDELYLLNKRERKEPKANFEGVAYERWKDAPNTMVNEQIGVQPVRSKALPPNKYGVFGLLGNVAEMTAHKGIAYGGSYETEASTLQRISYQGPQTWLGFRCIGLVED